MIRYTTNAIAAIRGWSHLYFNVGRHVHALTKVDMSTGEQQETNNAADITQKLVNIQCPLSIKR